MTTAFAQNRNFAADRTDRDMILIIHCLYLLGFVTGITAIAGVALAYWRRSRTTDYIARNHYDWQIRLFWLGILAWIAIGLSHGMVAAFGAITGGLGLVFMIVPWSMIAVWGVLTLWAIVRGILAALKGRMVVQGGRFSGF